MQDDLVDMLREEGYKVIQVIVFRDIKELYFVKVFMNNGFYKYSLLVDQWFNLLLKLKCLLMDVFVKIDLVSYMIVLKMMLGNVQVIGVLMDNFEWEEIMGMICGDDIILIICRMFEDMEGV